MVFLGAERVAADVVAAAVSAAVATVDRDSQHQKRFDDHSEAARVDDHPSKSNSQIMALDELLFVTKHNILLADIAVLLRIIQPC